MSYNLGQSLPPKRRYSMSIATPATQGVEGRDGETVEETVKIPDQSVSIAMRESEMSVEEAPIGECVKNVGVKMSKPPMKAPASGLSKRKQF